MVEVDMLPSQGIGLQTDNKIIKVKRSGLQKHNLNCLINYMPYMFIYNYQCSIVLKYCHLDESFGHPDTRNIHGIVTSENYRIPNSRRRMRRHTCCRGKTDVSIGLILSSPEYGLDLLV